MIKTLNKIYEKLINIMLITKNFLIIFFEIKSHQTIMYEFLDRLMTDVSLTFNAAEEQNVINDIKKMLDEMYGEKFIIQHTTLATKLFYKIKNINKQNDFLKEIRVAIKGSYDLKSFLILFLK